MAENKWAKWVTGVVSPLSSYTSPLYMELWDPSYNCYNCFKNLFFLSHIPAAPLRTYQARLVCACLFASWYWSEYLRKFEAKGVGIWCEQNHNSWYNIPSEVGIWANYCNSWIWINWIPGGIPFLDHHLGDQPAVCFFGQKTTSAKIHDSMRILNIHDFDFLDSWILDFLVGDWCSPPNCTRCFCQIGWYSIFILRRKNKSLHLAIIPWGLWIPSYQTPHYLEMSGVKQLGGPQLDTNRVITPLNCWKQMGIWGEKNLLIGVLTYNL